MPWRKRITHSHEVGISATTSDGITWTLSIIPGGFLDRTGTTDAGFFSNGIYQLVLHGSQITDAATATLNYNGGADQIVSFASNKAAGGISNYFHVLFGDYNGDGTVNATDAIRFSRGFLTSVGGPNFNALFDFNGDGTLNATDAIRFSRDFLVSYVY